MSTTDQILDITKARGSYSTSLDQGTAIGSRYGEGRSGLGGKGIASGSAVNAAAEAPPSQGKGVVSIAPIDRLHTGKDHGAYGDLICPSNLKGIVTRCSLEAIAQSTAQKRCKVLESDSIDGTTVGTSEGPEVAIAIPCTQITAAQEINQRCNDWVNALAHSHGTAAIGAANVNAAESGGNSIEFGGSEV